MDLMKKTIHMDQVRCSADAQTTVEDDINITDSKPDAYQLVTERGKVEVEEVRAMEDHVHIKGSLKFWVLYISDEEIRRPACMEGSLPFEEQVYLNGVNSSDAVTVRAVLEDLSVGMINSRKLSVQALVDFDLCVETVEEMEAAGVLNRFGGDLFRGRMMVPFIDVGGVIGFTARVIDQGEPKYLNTPETLLFNKGRCVFGLAQAKEAIRKNGFVVIVEGNMDVISSHQAGVREAVATSGTAMTENHLKALSRLTTDVRLAYDGDEAGVRATERAIMMAGDLGVNLEVISDYHGAKDPDELIQRDPELWKEAVQRHRPAVDWLLDKYEENLDLNSGAGKREYSDVAMKLLRYVRDAVERKHYEQLVARKLDCSVEDLRAKRVDTGARKRLKKVTTTALPDYLKGMRDDLEALMVYGGVTGIHGVEVAQDETRLKELELIFEARYKGWAPEALEQEAQALLKRYKQEMNRRAVEELQERLAEAEAKGDEREAEEILRQIMALKKA